VAGSLVLCYSKPILRILFRDKIKGVLDEYKNITHGNKLLNIFRGDEAFGEMVALNEPIGTGGYSGRQGKTEKPVSSSTGRGLNGYILLLKT